MKKNIYFSPYESIPKTPIIKSEFNEPALIIQNAQPSQLPTPIPAFVNYDEMHQTTQQQCHTSELSSSSAQFTESIQEAPVIIAATSLAQTTEPNWATPPSSASTENEMEYILPNRCVNFSFKLFNTLVFIVNHFLFTRSIRRRELQTSRILTSRENERKLTLEKIGEAADAIKRSFLSSTPVHIVKMPLEVNTNSTPLVGLIQYNLNSLSNDELNIISSTIADILVR